MHNDERLKSLPFDLFERYVLLQHIGEFFRPEASAFHVLDVGGDTPAFWPGFPSMAGAVIPGANPVVVDVHPHSRLRNSCGSPATAFIWLSPTIPQPTSGPRISCWSLPMWSSTTLSRTSWSTASSASRTGKRSATSWPALPVR